MVGKNQKLTSGDFVSCAKSLACPWSLVLGPWFLVTGHWSLVTGHWSLVTGPWSLVLGPWSLVLGPWSLVPRKASPRGLIFACPSLPWRRRILAHCSPRKYSAVACGISASAGQLAVKIQGKTPQP